MRTLTKYDHERLAAARAKRHRKCAEWVDPVDVARAREAWHREKFAGREMDLLVFPEPVDDSPEFSDPHETEIARRLDTGQE